MKHAIGALIITLLLAASGGTVFGYEEEPLLPAGTKSRNGSTTVKPETKVSTAGPASPAKAAPAPKTKPKSSAPAKSRRPEVPPDIDVMSEQERVIKYANSHLEQLRWGQRSCTECYVSSAGGDDSALANMTDSKRDCVDRWTDFYNKEPEDPNFPDGPKKPVDLRIVLGHVDEDIDSFVSDRVVRQSMVKALTAPCEENKLVRACGFKESPTDGDVFEKEVTNPQGQLQKVRLTLKASSSPAAVISKANQEIYSAAAEKTYFDGIKEADMLLYVGHARKGGGPDFRPAIRRANGTTDFDYYKREQPGLEALRKAFDNSKVNGKKKTPKIMGFLACDAEVWHERLRRNAPDSGLIISRTDQVDLQTAMGMAYLTLDSVLWQRCRDEFDRALNTLIDYRRERLVPLDLENFFGKRRD